MKPAPNGPCPCGSGRKLKRCCRRLHRGAAPADAEELMRSRYTAYATGEADYVLATTHPDGPQWRSDRDAWLADVRDFVGRTEFLGLRVTAREEVGERAWVTFRATLRQLGRDASFEERSEFRKGPDGRWAYIGPT